MRLSLESAHIFQILQSTSKLPVKKFESPKFLKADQIYQIVLDIIQLSPQAQQYNTVCYDEKTDL